MVNPVRTAMLCTLVLVVSACGGKHVEHIGATSTYRAPSPISTTTPPAPSAHDDVVSACRQFASFYSLVASKGVERADAEGEVGGIESDLKGVTAKGGDRALATLLPETTAVSTLVAGPTWTGGTADAGAAAMAAEARTCAALVG